MSRIHAENSETVRRCRSRREAGRDMAPPSARLFAGLSLVMGECRLRRRSGGDKEVFHAATLFVPGE